MSITTICNYPTHQPRKPFYITPYRQKDPASREKYASELHQVRILRLSKVDRTSCELMVCRGSVHFMLFQNLFLLCMKNWGKNNLFQRTYTELCWLCPRIHKTSVFVVTEQGIESLLFSETFVDHLGRCRRLPYTGSALARLERSTLPVHNGTRSIVLRFLKIITPVKCVISHYDSDGVICCPEEGELFRRNSNSDKKKHHVWGINIDKPSVMQRGLQLLWGT